MTQADAIRLVNVLGSYFRQEIAEETAVLWAKELLAWELSDGLEAAELAGKTQVYMPTLAEFLAMVRDVRNVRVVMRPELPSVGECCRGQGFGHFYRDHASKADRGRVDALMAKAKANPKPHQRVILEAFLKAVTA